MIAIRCPECQRLLNVAEDALGSPVSCPVCQCLFTALAPPEGIQKTPIAAAGLADQPIGENPPRHRTVADVDDGSNTFRIYRAFRRAALWLRIAALLDALSTLGCGFATVLDLERENWRSLNVAVILLAVGPGLSVVAVCSFLFAAQTMSCWKPLRDVSLPPPRQHFVLAAGLAVVELVKQITYLALSLVVNQGQLQRAHLLSILFTTIVSGPAALAVLLALTFTLIARHWIEREPFIS